MKTLLVLLSLLISTLAMSQLSGELASSKRPITSDFSYQINGYKPAKLVFNISVNEAGEVITCQLDKVASQGYSTPLMVKAVNHIKTNLHFHADSQYPKFQTGVVTITILKP